MEYLGPYRLLNVVNTGQTSRLWQAYDDSKREFLGIKTLLHQYRRDRTQVSMLKWEFQVGEKLDHERLIDIQRYMSDRGVPFLVMEWFSAPNLKHLLNRGYDQYCYYLPKVLPMMVEALGAFHEYGWIHRDIKPDNFLFQTETEQLKLIDFALARKIKGGFGRLFSPRSKVQGTGSYMSPEQIRRKSLDVRSDIYSLGCTIFELLAGKPPFTGMNMSDLLQRHLQSPAPSVSAKNKNVTPEMAELLQLMLAKNIEKRPKNCQDLAKMLGSIRIFRRTPKIPEKV
jgi:serine/threonine protein kinase